MTTIPLSLYVHFPWCVRKCPYCDFNSHGLREELPEREYIDALIDNLEQELTASSGRIIETVFIGGGTPSLVSPDGIGRLLDKLRDSGRLKPGAEITLEANPGATDEAHYAGYQRVGVNRLSIGVQSFNDQLLARIGRIHSGGQARQAIISAQQAGFKRINLDLMYALPGQTVVQAYEEVKQAIETGVEHLSIYQLTIENNTEFAHRPPVLPDTEAAWEMQQQAGSLLESAGYQQYEVSAWSRGAPGFHNLNYWRFGDYLAIGAGAHGKLSRVSGNNEPNIQRYWNHRHPRDYLAARKTGRYRGAEKTVATEEIVFEYLMNALRLKQGFDVKEFSQHTGMDADILMRRFAPLIRRDWLQREGDIIRASETGFRFLDSLLVECM